MKRTIALGCMVLALTAAALARDSGEVSFLRALFRSTPVDASLFDEAFTQRVPLADVQLLVDGYRKRLGELQAVTHDSSGDQLRFANGSLRATVQLDAAQKVAGLRFHDEQSEADRAAVERVLRADRADAAWFTQGFLDQFPLAQIDALTAQTRTAEGAFSHLESRAGVYYAVFANAENNIQIATSASGRIAFLVLGPATPRGTSP